MLRRAAPLRALRPTPIGEGLDWNRLGPVARAPEPEEVWLAVLTACVPFARNALVVLPHFESPQCSAATRLKRHFGAVSARCMARASPFPLPATGVAAAERVAVADAAAVPAVIAHHSPPAAALSSAHSLFGDVKSDSLDCVVFARNSFCEVHQRCPHFISEAHRVLRRHGVLCIVGHRPSVVLGPPAVSREFRDVAAYLADFRTDGERSVDDAHSDVFFPFTNVDRRWFTAVHEVSLDQVLATVRGWEWYRRCVADGITDGNYGVRRQRVVDPLDALEAVLHSRVACGEVPPRLKVAVEHVVVSCDNRKINAHTPDVQLGAGVRLGP